MPTTTFDLTTAAVGDAITAVEELLRRDQGMFDSAELLSVLDRVDVVVSLAADDDVAGLADVSAAGRAKASGQPLVDAESAKGGLLLDLWAGLAALR